MRVSIIIPVYNCEEYLENCIKSLLNQTLTEIEFVFINDGSTDNSLEILKYYEKNDNRIKLINQKNSGVSRARNIGLKYCSGEYIGFVDSDDFIEKDMYQNMYECASEKNLDFVICNYIKHIIKKDKDILQYCEFKPLKFNKDDIKQYTFEHFIIQQDNGFNWNKLYKRSLIEENNLKFNESLTINEDLLFNLEYLEKVTYVGYVEKYNYNYMIRENSAMSAIHSNGFNGMKLIYSKTLDNMKLWNLDILKATKLINEYYVKMPYSYCKQVFRNKNMNFYEINKQIKVIIEDEFTQRMLKVIESEEIRLSLRYYIFYKVCNYEIIIFIYLYLLNIISNIKRHQ